MDTYNAWKLLHETTKYQTSCICKPLICSLFVPRKLIFRCCMLKSAWTTNFTSIIRCISKLNNILNKKTCWFYPSEIHQDSFEKSGRYITKWSQVVWRVEKWKRPMTNGKGKSLQRWCKSASFLMKDYKDNLCIFWNIEHRWLMIMMIHLTLT